MNDRKLICMMSHFIFVTHAQFSVLAIQQLVTERVTLIFYFLKGRFIYSGWVKLYESRFKKYQSCPFFLLNMTWRSAFGKERRGFILRVMVMLNATSMFRLWLRAFTIIPDFNIFFYFPPKNQHIFAAITSPLCRRQLSVLRVKTFDGKDLECFWARMTEERVTALDYFKL